MKKVALTLVVLLIGTAAFAQMKGGIKAGLNLSKYNYDIDGVGSGDENGTSFHVGGYLTFALSDKIGVQPELLYNAFTGEDSELKLNFISIPVLLVYNINEMINIHGGLQYGMLISTDPSDAKDDLKGDFSIPIGLGGTWGKFNAAARYCIGVGNVSDLDGFELKINNFQLSVGYMLFGGE